MAEYEDGVASLEVVPDMSSSSRYLPASVMMLCFVVVGVPLNITALCGYTSLLRRPATRQTRCVNKRGETTTSAKVLARGAATPRHPAGIVHMFIFTMSAVELVTTAIVIPLDIADLNNYMYDGFTAKSALLCAGYQGIKSWMMLFTALLMAAVALERYASIRSAPGERLLTKTRAALVIAGIGLYSFALGAVIFGFFLTSQRADLDREDIDRPDAEYACTASWWYDDSRFQAFRYFHMAHFWAAFLVANVAYARIMCLIVNKRQTRYDSEQQRKAVLSSMSTFKHPNEQLEVQSSATHGEGSLAVTGTEQRRQSDSPPTTKGLSSGSNSFRNNNNNHHNSINNHNNNNNNNIYTNRSSLPSLAESQEHLLTVPDEQTRQRSSSLNKKTLGQGINGAVLSLSDSNLDKMFKQANKSKQLLHAVKVKLSLTGATARNSAISSHLAPTAAAIRSREVARANKMRRLEKLWRGNIKTALVLFAVTLVFLVLYSPTTIVMILSQSSAAAPFIEQLPQHILLLLFSLHYGHCAINPVIYMFGYAPLRQRLVAMFKHHSCYW